MAQVDSPLSDRELMRLAQAGETASFDLLVRRYRPALERVARSRLGRDDWADDVVQETFLAAYRFRHTYNPAYGVRTWLWTILLNQCRAHQARQSRVVASAGSAYEADEEGESLAGIHALASGDPEPLSQLLAREQAERLERLLRCLSLAQADALRLRFFGGLKFDEIAQTMGCSLATAKNRVRWGLLRLANLAAGEEAHAKPGLPTERALLSSPDTKPTDDRG